MIEAGNFAAAQGIVLENFAKQTHFANRSRGEANALGTLIAVCRSLTADR